MHPYRLSHLHFFHQSIVVLILAHFSLKTSLLLSGVFMFVVNESNLSDRCIPSILQLRSGQALLRTGQREYRPRNPVSTPLYKIVEDYWEMFINTYDDKFQENYGFFRPVVKSEMEKYLNCGILRNGFIRIRCPECKEEYLLPFSCKDRCLCPSCTAKRSVLFADFIANEVIEPVPHRHLVFSLPKIIRPYFKFDRKLVMMLSRCAYESVKEICQTVFDENGKFYPLQHISLSYIKGVFEQEVLIGLRMKELISEETIKLIKSWQHTGFHVHHETRISAGDTTRIEKVASYLIRSPISLERLSYNDQNANITYRGKRDIYNFHPLTFLAQLSLHIANHGEQMVRYYGWYSNKKRGMRKKHGILNKPIILSEDLTDYQKSCRKRWAALIRKIYEVDPLICPKCGAMMKIVSAIEDDIAIHKILSHLGLLHSPSRSPPPLITTPWKREPDYHSDYIPDIEVY